MSLWLYARAIRRLERGATATEYALIISGIAVVLVAAIALLGARLQSRWDYLGSFVGGL